MYKTASFPFEGFKVPLDFCFYFSLWVQRAAKASQPQNRVFSDKLQKHDYLCVRRRDRASFILLRCRKKKKKKDSLTLPLLSPSPPPLNICPSVTSPLQTAQCNLSRLSTRIWRAIKALAWSNFILKIMAISQQPEHNCSFVKGEVPKMQTEHKGEKVSSGKSLQWKKMRHELEYRPLLP